MMRSQAKITFCVILMKRRRPACFKYVSSSSNNECRDWKLIDRRLQVKPINVFHIFVFVGADK